MTVWLVVATALVIVAWTARLDKVNEPPLLPDYSPSRRASVALHKYFPSGTGLSAAAVIFERAESLNRADFDAIERIASLIAKPSPPADDSDMVGVTVRSPASLSPPVSPLTGQPLWRNLLVSRRGDSGQAAMILVSLPWDYISVRSDRVVRHVRSILDSHPLPPGLAVAVSGSAGFGHDYAEAAIVSHKRAVKVTVVAVVLILLAVYCSPVAPLVPVGAISLATVVAFACLALAEHLGLHTGTAEDIFVFVLIYGAGVDYTLLLISRHREMLAGGLEPSVASREALTRTLSTIVAAAFTVTVGLAMMSFARYGVFRTAGPAVAMALIIALIAAVTLAPALVGLAGKRLYWPQMPSHEMGSFVGTALRQRAWAALARLVTSRPRLVLIVTLAALAWPAWQGANVRWIYDTLATIITHREGRVGGAARGLEVAERHWPVGEIGPLTLLVESPAPLSNDKWIMVARKVTDDLLELPGVAAIRGVSCPLGSNEPAAANLAAGTVGWSRVAAEYLSPDGKAMRMTVLLDRPALTLEAMTSLRQVRSTTEVSLVRMVNGATAMIAGPTAEMADVRDVTQADFRLIAALSLAAIFFIVLLLLRDVLLTAFMVTSTLISYLAALGVSYWVFVGLFGDQGLDWKVEVFLFVVMVAVGQDYNIFFAGRLAQEAAVLPLARATRRAMVHTGPVISSCGVIMAATLGSLMSGRLLLLRQLGFALALGMLIDTFVVRPLLLPAFAVATGRTGRGRLGH